MTISTVFSLPLRLSIGGFIANLFVLALVSFAISPRSPLLFPMLQVFATPPRMFSFHLEPFFSLRIDRLVTPSAQTGGLGVLKVHEDCEDTTVVKERKDSGPTSQCAQLTLQHPREPGKLPRDGHVEVDE